MIDETLLKSEEKAVLALRSLYRRYGFLPYRMSKFEEYELYIRNKDFLVSDRIITFNDTSGRLMALKPDVTLSIIKNGEDTPGFKQKVYYDENVYRVSDRTHRFREFMQTGCDCIGDIGLYDIFEVIQLAAQSLKLISSDFVLEVSLLGLIEAMLSRACGDSLFGEKALGFIAEKNAHDLSRLCTEYNVSAADEKKLQLLITAYGERHAVISALEGECAGKELDELKALSKLLDLSPDSDKIRFDFSVVNNMSYYNGFVFRGFLDGVCDGVLAGGQYDRLMAKMNRKSGAVGFAIYLDELEQLQSSDSSFDIDVLVLYDDSVSAGDVAKAVAAQATLGKSVSAQKCVSDRLRAKETVDIRREDAKC